MGTQGWSFNAAEGVVPDSHDSGRVTVAVVWDKKQRTIVSDESSEIIRMFNSGFATSQQACEEAVWPLLATLVRFDPVDVGPFKCNIRRLIDFDFLTPHGREHLASPVD